MFIAQQKRKENISEFVLYMFQVEDIIRALELQTDKIERYVEDNYQVNDPNQRDEIKEWYLHLRDELVAAHHEKAGHTAYLDAVLDELYKTHLALLKNPAQGLYSSLYYKTLPYLVQLRSMSGTDQTQATPNEVQTAYIAVYGYITLKLKQQPISPETEEAVKHLSTYLAMLADRYHALEEGEIEL